MTQTKEEKVLTAARSVFMRYAFKRATMSDLADAAQMSRPAVYLIFSSKEEVLQALVTQIFNELLLQVREGLSKHDSVADKLTFAFEVWCVRPFEMIQASPDAKDILESGYEFAAEITLHAFSDFETILLATSSIRSLANRNCLLLELISYCTCHFYELSILDDETLRGK